MARTLLENKPEACLVRQAWGGGPSSKTKMADKYPKGAAWKADRKQSSNEKHEVEYRLLRRIKRKVQAMKKDTVGVAEPIGYRMACDDLLAYLKRQK